uniref:CCHC-type domain-containing protein n=1 Tax=Trichuris muris TaxID=70415 RepID=A0A5S6QGQ9_TRIMR
MVYLQSALVGEALDAIHGFTVTNANYPVVVEILRERFGRQDAVVEAHVLSLLKPDKLERNSDRKLRELYDQLKGHIRALSAIGKDISKKELTAEDILLVLFKQRLPYHVRKRWEQKLLTDGHNCYGRLDLFFEFLRVEVESEECTKGAPLLARDKDSRNVNGRASQGSPKERRDNISSKNEKRSTAAALQAVVRTDRRQLSDEKRGMTATGATSKRIQCQCPVCREIHPPGLCPTFIDIPVEQRWKKCKEVRLCFRCLRPGHCVRNCNSDDAEVACVNIMSSFIVTKARKKYKSAYYVAPSKAPSCYRRLKLSCTAPTVKA